MIENLKKLARLYEEIKELEVESEFPVKLSESEYGKITLEISGSGFLLRQYKADMSSHNFISSQNNFMYFKDVSAIQDFSRKLFDVFYEEEV